MAERSAYDGRRIASGFSEAGFWLIDKLESVPPLYTNNVQKLVPDVELFNLWRRVAYVLSRSDADDVLGMAEAIAANCSS